jgi:hypothetical protein
MGLGQLVFKLRGASVFCRETGKESRGSDKRASNQIIKQEVKQGPLLIFFRGASWALIQFYSSLRHFVDSVIGRRWRGRAMIEEESFQHLKSRMEKYCYYC